MHDKFYKTVIEFLEHDNNLRAILGKKDTKKNCTGY